MKLAEALSIRKELNRKIEQLQARLLANIKLQECDEPTEPVEDLMKSLDNSLKTLEELIARINKTNMHTLHNGRTLTEMMAEKEVLTLRVSILRDVFNKANEGHDRYSRSEIKLITTIDVRNLSKQIDKLAEKLRKLDIEIQGLNFLVELED